MKCGSKLYGLFAISCSLTLNSVYAAHFLTSSEQDYSHGVRAFSQSNAAVDLGMNGVPVLSQGQFGTSVSFATTAALDALLGKGDFIDQSCTEALTPFASEFATVIKALQEFGVVEKTSAQNKCEQSISIDQYKALVHPSVSVSSVQFAQIPLTLQSVRESLNKGRRVLFGFGLKGQADPISVVGFDLVIKDKKYNVGLWACKQASSSKNYCGYSSDGHVLLIIGYDDEQQLFKMRNSWGDTAGENGDFYMSYEFFEKMAVLGTEVWM